MISLRSYSSTVGARAWLIASLGLLLSLMAVGRAEAGVLVDTTTDCDRQALEQPFLRWADPASYTLVPGGSFSEGAGRWRLSQSRLVADNEPWNVHGDARPASLRIDAGGSATSPAMCVGLEHPTLRFFARNVGSLLGSLVVEVLFEDAQGQVHALPISAMLGDFGWQPTMPAPIVANLLPLLPGAHTPVAFRFHSATGGEWLIDDVYVDPYRKG